MRTQKEFKPDHCPICGSSADLEYYDNETFDEYRVYGITCHKCNLDYQEVYIELFQGFEANGKVLEPDKEIE